MAAQQQTLEALTNLIGDKYDIVRWIGGGGMAEVYLARHRVTGGYFAVKVLADYLAGDERIVARFIQEARTAANLSGHPNIVAIFDIGEGSGVHYLIMQYIAGEDLSHHLRRSGHLSPPDASNIVAQVAEALAWSTSKGVVHRDLKPSNLYLDRNGRIVVLDFGIAKATDVPSALTAAGERLGTPYYMCPEQIRGEDCDARSDLYSLGIIYFELLSGRKPFEGDSYRAIEMAHVTTAPPDLCALDPSIHPEYVRIVDKLLAKSPADRYQSPAELLYDLNNVGATPTPSVLRPELDSGIEEELARRTPTSAMLSTTPSRRSTPPPGASSAPTVAAIETPAGIAARTAEAAAPAAPKSSNLPIFLGIGLLALVILGAGAYLLLKPKSPTEAPPVANATQATPQTAQLPATLTSDKTGGVLDLVPAGKFIFGNNSDSMSPNAEETAQLDAYYVDQTEVSNKQYKLFCDATGHKAPAGAEFLAQPDWPVVGVSLDDAKAYATWAGERVPSEKEWEKAARGANGLVFPWGNDAWADPPTEMQAVLSQPERRSPYGAYNMAGNAAEWTSTHFPAGNAEFADMTKALGMSNFSHNWFAIKGGYFGRASHPEVFFKAYMRRGWPEDQASPVIGFRCVKDAGS